MTRFEVDGNDVDAHAAVGCAAGLAIGVAEVLVAVGEEDDPLGRVGGEERLRSLDCGGEVGVLGIGERFESARDAMVGRRRGDLDSRVATEGDHGEAVVENGAPLALERRLDVLEHRLPVGGGDAEGLVEEVDDGQLVALATVLGVGQGEDNSHGDQRTEGERGPTTPAAETGEAAMAEPRQHWDQRQQGEVGRSVEDYGVFEHGEIIRKVERRV